MEKCSQCGKRLGEHDSAAIDQAREETARRILEQGKRDDVKS